MLTRQRPMILQDLGAFRRDRAELDQLVERQLVLLELADGERRAVDRERRHDDVDARAVRQARVADRRGFVDAAADLADDALADVQQLLVVAEADAGLLDLAGDFDVDRAGAVDHDVGDVVARQQRLERAVAEHVVADVVEQLFLLGDRHHDVLDRDDLVDDVADFLARGLGVEPARAARDRSPRSARRRSCPWSRNRFRSAGVSVAGIGGWRGVVGVRLRSAPRRAARRGPSTETACGRGSIGRRGCGAGGGGGAGAAPLRRRRRARASTAALLRFPNTTRYSNCRQACFLPQLAAAAA